MGSFAGILKRDRSIIAAGIVLVTVLAWWYTVAMAGASNGAAMPMARPDPNAWSAGALLPLFIMWVVMMVAMMLPSATPMILTFAAVARNRRQHQRPYVPVAVFASGYLVVWGGFSVVATVAQWLLHRAALLSPMMVSRSALLGGGLLLLAGIFQFTPLKRSCLTHCRAPLEFISTRWREGWWGSFVMGLEHGLFCTGCCWALMCVLFAVGVMNLLAVAALASLIALEKMSSFGRQLSRVTGAALVIGGLITVAAS